MRRVNCGVVVALAFLAGSMFLGCGSGSSVSAAPPTPSTVPSSSGNGGNSAQPAPVIAFSTSATTITVGQQAVLQWTTTGASTVTISPPISSTPLPLSSEGFLIQPTVTTSYMLTATGAGGTSTASVSINVAPQNTLVINNFTAMPATVSAGQVTTLNWATSNATSLSISPVIPIAEETGPLPLSGSAPVTPTQTTTYTITATGANNSTTIATVQVTVTSMTLGLSASPASVSPGQTATLSWQTGGGVNHLTIDNGIGDVSSQLPNGSVTVQPNTSTTYTATASGAGGSIQQSATVSVQAATTGTLKHIVFMLQENRSFDDYFGMLGPYRVQRLAPFGISAAASDIDGLNCADLACSNITLYTRTTAPKPNAAVHPFHFTTACIENLSPSWDESHYDVHITNNDWSPTTQPGFVFNQSMFQMDYFLQTTTSVTLPAGAPEYDPNGTRPLGYYNGGDLPFYYDLATFFATSDRWFSPLLANTIPNRMYIFAGTSFGHIFPDVPPSGGFSPETIFEAMTKAGVSWRYYYLDNSIFLAQFQDWDKPGIQQNVKPISEYYSILQGNCSGQPCNADDALPQVVFIERAGSTLLDEHPDNFTNAQKGAALVQQIITALMNSTAWNDSAFIFSYDEAGGLYDHVPPFQEPSPDNYEPGHCADSGVCRYSSSDAKATFNTSGLRLPFAVISPWAKPHYVSHTPRDTTAILAFIEETFSVPSLTARDAYYKDPSRDMNEFFDFSTPALLNAPNGQTWGEFLAPQPTNLPCSPALGVSAGFNP